MKLSDKQKKLLALRSTKYKVDYYQLIKWVESGETTMSEISQGVLGTPSKDNFYASSQQHPLYS